jgi:3-oxoacyl-[acyl-carrier protein] reductase
MTVEQADRLWAIDVRAVFTASQAAARHMSEGGRIITIGSALAERVNNAMLARYSAHHEPFYRALRAHKIAISQRGFTPARRAMSAC